MQEYLDVVWNWIVEYSPNIIGALLILIIGRILIGLIVSGVRGIMKRTNVDETLSKFLLSVMKIILMTVLVLAALDRLQVETTSFVAILGAAGLAIGFAMQGSLGNMASGVMIMIFRPFKAGDYVEAGGTAGVIKEVSIFTTVMNTPDNKRVIIPNGQITGGNITNYSAMETRRVDMVFGIGYGDDIKLAKQTLDEILAADDRILKDPAPTVAVSELADSSVNFVVRPWVKTADYWAVYFDVTEKVKMTFDAKGISIPFPQQDVHMHQVTAV